MKLTGASRVREAIVVCEETYRSLGEDIRVATERCEILWFSIDNNLASLERAEALRDVAKQEMHLERILFLVEKLRSAYRDR